MRKVFLVMLAMFLLISSTFSYSVLAAKVILRPNAQGVYESWTNVGCTNSSEWDCVDEASPNINDSVYSNVNNAKESFLFTDTGLTTEKIFSLSLKYYGMRYGNSMYIHPLIRVGLTNYLSLYASYLGYSYAYLTAIYPKNPATNADWTIAELDNLQAGMASRSTYGGGKVAQMYAEVEYDNPAVPADLIVYDLKAGEWLVNGNETGNETANSTSTVMVSVYGRIKNIGADTAGASVTRIDGLVSKNVPHTYLTPGPLSYFNSVYECTAGHTAIATADIYNTVAESNETNNQASIYVDCVV